MEEIMEINIRKKSGKTPNGVLALSEKSIEEAAKQLGTSARSISKVRLSSPDLFYSGYVSIREHIFDRSPGIIR
jgi:hypothetical protein